MDSKTGALVFNVLSNAWIRQVLQTLNAVGLGIHEGFGQFSDNLANLYSSSLSQINLPKNDIFLGKDISKVVDSKTGALVFIGGNAFNYTVDAAGTVSSGLGQAGNFINGITLEGMENATIR